MRRPLLAAFILLTAGCGNNRYAFVGTDLGRTEEPVTN